MAYIIYCDESSDKGEKYCDFFGGCMINSADQHELTVTLEQKKKELHLEQEVKWTKVTENYLSKYTELIDLFFDFVQAGRIKVRIMFRAKTDAPANMGNISVDDKYFKLYYQFLKHSFGLMHIPVESTPVNLIIFLDTLPDKHGKRDEFKAFLANMPNSRDFRGVDIRIRSRDIIEVDSRDHVLLQCTDIILGSMQFKLNGLNLLKPEGKNRRGKRTIAKDQLYRHIQKRICEIHPNFNIGVSTGDRGLANPHWESPYEHWLFRSKENA